MRALGDPDAFPSQPTSVCAGQRSLPGIPKGPEPSLSPGRALAPVAAYATQYLWATLDHPINNLPSGMGGANKPRTKRSTA